MDQTPNALAIQDAQGLSEVIIQTLRGINNNRQPLTTSLLAESLSRQPAIAEFLEKAGEISHSGPRGKKNVPPQDPAAAAYSARIQAQRDSLLKELDSKDLELTMVWSFCQRAVASLSRLIREPRSEALLTAMERLRESLNEKPDIQQAEEALRSLKNVILQSDFQHEEKPADKERESSRLSGLLGRITGGVRQGMSAALPPQDPSLAKFKRLVLSVLDEFRFDLGETYRKHLAGLQERIREAKESGDLSSMRAEIISLIRSYMSHVHNERSQVVEFIETVGRDLLEIEGQLTSSFSAAHMSLKTNSDFHGDMKLKMADVHEALFADTSLANLRTQLVTKLNTIKTAIEEKHEEDMLRLREAESEMRKLQVHLKELTGQVQQMEQRASSLEQEVMIDHLTRIYNRRAYEGRLREEMERYRRYNQAFSMLLVDVDHFKNVNDRFGHGTGDRCLQEIVARVQSLLRAPDFMARLGGEEFVIILSGTEKQGALNVAEKVRKKVEETHFFYGSEQIPVTVSVGATQMSPSDTTEREVFERLDAAMYDAKNAGRNKVAWR